MFSLPETGIVERESSAVDQLPAGHTQHGSLVLLHTQLRDTARLDTQHPKRFCYFKGEKTFPAGIGRDSCQTHNILYFTIFLQSKCWWFGAGHAAIGSPTRGVGHSGRWRRCHLTRPIQTEDTHVQRRQHSKSGNPHIPQHASLYPCQQRTSSSCDCQPAGDPHPASQHASDPNPNTHSYTATAAAQKESVTYGKVELGSWNLLNI